jgi:hypothetical protein
MRTHSPPLADSSTDRADSVQHPPRPITGNPAIAPTPLLDTPQPPGLDAPSATITVLHAPTRTCVVDTFGGAINDPDSPVFAAQVIVQFAVAVTGQVPEPPVRSGVDRTWNMYAHVPAAGSAVVSTEGPGFAPGPWQMIGADWVPRLSAETGSPIVQVTEDSRATAVTDTAPAEAVAVTPPGSFTHK